MPTYLNVPNDRFSSLFGLVQARLDTFICLQTICFQVYELEIMSGLAVMGGGDD